MTLYTHPPVILLPSIHHAPNFNSGVYPASKIIAGNGGYYRSTRGYHGTYQLE